MTSEQKLSELRQRIGDALPDGVSLREASRTARMAPNQFSRILNSQIRHTPKPTTCHKIAAYFGWDPDEVLYLAGHRTTKHYGQRRAMAALSELLESGSWTVGQRQAILRIAANRDAPLQTGISA